MDMSILTIISSVASAILSAVVSILVCLINNNKQIAIINVQLAEMKETIKKHNDLVERIYKLEEKVSHLEKEYNNG